MQAGGLRSSVAPTSRPSLLAGGDLGVASAQRSPSVPSAPLVLSSVFPLSGPTPR